MNDYLRSRQPFFGKWFVGSKIGQGTYGKIYTIYHMENGVRLDAAMKVITVPHNEASIDELRAQGFTDQEIADYYERQILSVIGEIQIMNRFRGHDHIVCYEDHVVLRHPTKLRWDICIRMEKLERLEEYLKRTRANRWQVVQLWYDIAAALVDCHRANVLHRDIKPDNILVSKEGYFKLVDFGISRYLESDLASTLAGTYPYMAPEVADRKTYDHRADIYSLGVVVYQLLNANRYPFLPPYPKQFSADDRDRAINQRFSGKKIQPIHGVSGSIMRVLLKTLAFDPNDRYPNAEALLKDIEKIHVSHEEAAIPLFDERGNPNLPTKRNPGKRILIALAAVMLVYVAAMLLYFLLK